MSKRFSAALLCMTIALLVGGSTSSLAADDEQPTVKDEQYIEDCTKLDEQQAPGVYIQSLKKGDSTDATGGIAGIPPRVQKVVQPTESGRLCVGFQNRTGKNIELVYSVADIRPGKRPGESPITVVPTDREYGAAKWLTLPTTRTIQLEHGQIGWVKIDVRVPGDVTAGSHYSAIEGRIKTKRHGKGEKAGVVAQLSPAVAVQLFFDVPGDSARSGKVVDLDYPHVVWWDGLKLGSIPILDKLRGRESAPFRFKWRNTGDYTDEVSGRVTIDSDVSKKTVARIEVPTGVVLRDSERPFEVRWIDGIPLMGRFTPTLEMRGTDGRIEKRELHPIWVIPTWWYVIALIIALAIPITLRRRSKRRYQELVARVEAAEARGSSDDEFDGDAWDDDEGWDDPSGTP